MLCRSTIVFFLLLVLVSLLQLVAAQNKVGPKHNYRMVCYVGTWAVYRPDNGKFTADSIDPNLCTHLVYAFAGLDNATNTIKSLDPNADMHLNGYKKFVGLKAKNPRLKVLIAIGGWNEGAERYSKMASSKEARTAFISSVVEFVGQHKFDGLDLDWEYPGQVERGGKPYDKNNFVDLVKELKAEFKPRGWLLTAAIGAPQTVIDYAYEIPPLSRDLDFINIMCYDYHGSWNNFTGHNAPLFARPDEGDAYKKMNINHTVHHLLKLGAPASSLVLGMPLYGHTFVLNNPKEMAPGSGSVISQGLPGPYTKQVGFMGYNEFCEDNLNKPWVKARDNYQKVPYAALENNWFSYDDAESLKSKVEFAVKMKLGGGMVWSLETDDFMGLCNNGKFPLLNAINDAFINTPIPTDEETNEVEDDKKTNGSNAMTTTGTCVLLSILTLGLCTRWM